MNPYDDGIVSGSNLLKAVREWSIEILSYIIMIRRTEKNRQSTYIYKHKLKKLSRTPNSNEMTMFTNITYVLKSIIQSGSKTKGN